MDPFDAKRIALAAHDLGFSAAGRLGRSGAWEVVIDTQRGRRYVTRLDDWDLFCQIEQARARLAVGAQQEVRQ